MIRRDICNCDMEFGLSLERCTRVCGRARTRQLRHCVQGLLYARIIMPQPLDRSLSVEWACPALGFCFDEFPKLGNLRCLQPEA